MSSTTGVKVAVLGAAGGIGQPLSLLLATTVPGITHLTLYDIVNVNGVAADLMHCNSGVTVTGHLGPDQLPDALRDAQLVVIPAGLPRKPGMSRDDLFNINAGIVRDLATACAQHCPNAIIAIISNPVNSTVPVAVEVLRRHGKFDARRVLGVTTLDSVRAATFVHENVASVPINTRVTVLGGHSGHTIVPVLSRLAHGLDQAKLDALVNRVQFGGDEVVQAKQGAGSATLSMAYAARRFVESLLRARTTDNVVESAYVYIGDDSGIAGADAIRAKVGSGCSFLAVDVALTKDGATRALPIEGLTEYEEGLLKNAVQELKGSIAKGVEFVQASKL